MNKRVVALGSVLLLGLSVLLFVVLRSGLMDGPDEEPKLSSLQLAGLRESVTVRRDERGIPHIEAASQDDLYFALGYVMASDRLWQMDLLRRTATGELAEILGQTTLEEDKRHRTLRLEAVAEQTVERLSRPARVALEAYTKGVNAIIESLDKSKSFPEFRVLRYKPRLWRPADSLVIGKLYAETLTTTWQTDMMRSALAGLSKERLGELLPSTSPLDVVMVGSDNPAARQKIASRPVSLNKRRTTVKDLGEVARVTDETQRSLERVGLYAEDLAASNNWVVSGQRSATGKPLLANDPHMNPSAPSIWYMVHLTAPGLNVAGATIAGLPSIVVGHNDQIAWGMTNVEADVQDLYDETFDKDNPKRYKTPEGWREAEVHQEEIMVRKNPADPAAEAVKVDVTVTRHGPIILEQDGHRYALGWTALDPAANEIEAYYFINRARNWQEFRSALSAYMGVPLNFVYADVEGHIGYWAAGRSPIRKAGQGVTPLDGASSEGDWTGYIPFDAAPHIYDPPSGIIITANNRVVGADYPYYITQNWAAPYRARRIYNLLTAKDKLTVEDFRAIQADTYSMPDAIFAAEVVKLGSGLVESSPEWREILAAFNGGDSMMNADSRVVLISSAMRGALQRRILENAIGEEAARKYNWASAGTFIDYVITTRPREWLPKDFDSYEALILACYKDALDTLAKRLGSDKSQWTWGRWSQVRFQHPLATAPAFGAQFAIAPFPQTGGGQAINRGANVSMRYIADTSDWDNTRQGVPLGESGNPASPHWKDQLESWRAVTPSKFPFNKTPVTDATKTTLTLNPAEDVEKH